MDQMNRGKGISRDDLKNGHPRLDDAKTL